MKTIVSIRARARARAFPVDARSGVAALRSIGTSTKPAIERRRVALRAHWFLDSVSRRLECRWSSENEEPRSRVAPRSAIEVQARAS